MPTSTAAKSPAGQSSKSTPALRPKEAFQDLILTLQQFWGAQGCVILQPYDMEVGAGTFHPATTVRALGPKPWSAAALLPVPGDHEAVTGEHPGTLSREP